MSAALASHSICLSRTLVNVSSSPGAKGAPLSPSGEARICPSTSCAVGAAVPVAYHTLTIGGAASATLGMRLFGLEVRVWNGGKPGYLQALLHTAVFYVTVSFTGGLILLWALFNNRGRCLHDILCGTLVIRRPAGG